MFKVIVCGTKGDVVEMTIMSVTMKKTAWVFEQLQNWVSESQLSHESVEVCLFLVPVVCRPKRLSWSKSSRNTFVYLSHAEAKCH